MRHGSWFQNSKLTLQEVLYLTYDILRREPAVHIKHEHHFNDHTIADWGMFCRGAMLVFLEGCFEKIGGPNKTAEIDESKFGRRKYHRGTLLRPSVCLSMLNAKTVEHFLFPFRTETLSL
jgi:hypothetical protein